MVATVRVAAQAKDRNLATSSPERRAENFDVTRSRVTSPPNISFVTTTGASLRQW
jgi:hypothetical protein